MNEQDSHVWALDEQSIREDVRHQEEYDEREEQMIVNNARKLIRFDA